MIKLLLFAVVLTSSGGVQVQTSSRAERKKPLSESVEKALAEFVQSCVPEKEKQLAAHMEEVIKTIGTTVTLTPEEALRLQQAAKQAVNTTLKTWSPKAQEALRTYLTRTSSTAAIRHIGIWKTGTTGPNEPVEDWVPPEDDAAWLAALQAVLGADRYARWHEEDLKARRQAETKIMEYLERWVRESRSPMNEDLSARINLMKKTLELSDQQADSLNKAAENLLDAVCNAERRRASSMLLTLPPAARDYIMGLNRFYISFDRPVGESWNSAWLDAASKVLPADTITRWKKKDGEERLKLDKELADMIRPSEQQAEQRMLMDMQTEVEGIVQTLKLSKDRKQALDQLSKQAVQASLNQARKKWLQQARNYQTADRKRIRGNIYFGVNDEDQAIGLPVWTDGLKKLLSESERTRMKEENTRREQRQSFAIACACLAEMDQTLMLAPEQRTKLEPLLQEVMRTLLDQRRQQYWSFNAPQLFSSAGKASKDGVRAILNDVQWLHWKELVDPARNSSRNVTPDINASSGTVLDIEAAISKHMYKMFVAERTKTLAVMMPQVEEASRLLSLPEASVASLTTAAKGAVEYSLASWRRMTESYVRQSTQNATRENLLQTLAATAHVNFNRNDTRPQNTEIWQLALRNILDESQRKKLGHAAAERQSYRLAAMSAMSISELDRRRHLSADQCARLQTAVEKVLADYLPDIERYMSFQWFLQYYYVMLPLAGVPEKDLQAVLTPDEWKLCNERDLPDVRQYWDGVKTNHEQRMRQGARTDGGQINFNGGFMIDQ